MGHNFEDEPDLCPLITQYTREQGYPDEHMEKLFRMREWRVPEDGPIPFHWPTRLRPTVWSLLKNADSGVAFDPKQYQIQMMHMMVRMLRFINGDSVGLGKTIETIMAICWLMERLPKMKVILLATKSTTLQWADEFTRFSTLRPRVMKDSYKKKTSYAARFDQLEDFLNNDNHDVLVCKYSSMVGVRKKVEGMFDDEGYPAVNGRERIASEVRRFHKIIEPHGENILLITDECQKYKTVGGPTRTMVQILSTPCARVYALTATIIKNGIDEMYSIASAIGIRPLGSPAEFESDFCIYRTQRFSARNEGRILQGYVNIPRFKREMRPFFFGRSQRQVKEPLPRLSTMIHPIDLDPYQTRLLLEDIPSGRYVLPPKLVKTRDGIVSRDRDASNEMTMLSVFQLVANHPGLLNVDNKKEFLTKSLSPKEELLLDMLDGDYRGEKVICFAQPLTSRVLTPGGWVNMGDLKVGDPVIDPDGGIGFVEGVFPQGVKPVYSVKMKSGSQTRATGDHLWWVQTHSDIMKGKPGRIKTTDQMKAKGLKRVGKAGGSTNSYNKFFLPVAAPSEFTSSEVLPIPAYTLGVLLGDGYIREFRNAPSFTSMDQEIVDRVTSELLPGMKLQHREHGRSKASSYTLQSNEALHFSRERDALGMYVAHEHGKDNPYIQALASLGLHGSRSNSKFIPEMYLLASIKDRMALLQGLMDTDGCCTKLGHSSLVSTSERLAKDVAALVHSLGGIATLGPPTHNAGYRKDSVFVRCLPIHQVSVQLSSCPFFLSRKASRWHAPKRALRSAIRAIEPVGDAECQCIRVSTKRSLYITDDYIVTHNTKSRSWIDRLEHLTKEGNFTSRKFLRITGAESEMQRGVAKRLFQDPDSGYDVIFINEAATEGVNLQQAAHLIALDLPWSWGNLLQLVGRMVRMASPHSACMLHVFAARGTVDEYAIETLQCKKGVFEKILGESHSAGLLDDREIFDMESGMEQAAKDDEFLNMMKAHVKESSLQAFTQGKQLEAAKTDVNYKMVHEPGAKEKRKLAKAAAEQEEFERAAEHWG